VPVAGRAGIVGHKGWTVLGVNQGRTCNGGNQVEQVKESSL
jgi:hypothetical protein